jgi:hypothetical protein
MIFVKKEAGKEGGKVESEDAIGKFQFWSWMDTGGWGRYEETFQKN